MVPDVGPVMGRRLLDRFRSPAAIFNASGRELLSVGGMTPAKAEAIAGFSGWKEAEATLSAARQGNIDIIGCTDDGYPEPLRALEDAPVLLYSRGRYDPDDRFGIAVVGARQHSSYGEAVTHRIATELAAAGFTIVSGLARGIDTIAHRAALSAGGRTIAVLGSGVDVCYPSENRRLMEQVAEAGCVMSEFPPGSEPRRENFPRRNRLISGLSLGVLVIEASEKSGALITAAAALEQNREVFAVPGNITSRISAGTNRLIKEGAKAVLGAEDVIEELAPVLRGFLRRRRQQELPALTDEEKGICGTLCGEPKHIDLIAREALTPVSRTLNILLALELKGVVRQTGGKRFYLIQEAQ